MPSRDFRSIEYCRLMNDFTWNTQNMLVPYELSYHEAIAYILNELKSMGLADNISNISILQFPEVVVTVTG